MINGWQTKRPSYCFWYICMRYGSKWRMIGPRPCAYACAYVDPVFTSQSYDISTSTRRANLSVFLMLMLMLMSTQFSLAYTCNAHAYSYASAYALVKILNQPHAYPSSRDLRLIEIQLEWSKKMQGPVLHLRYSKVSVLWKCSLRYKWLYHITFKNSFRIF